MTKQKVALVLSMGGARGIAHIGVIETLLKHHFEITSITGSSMGAMVGAMYATGKLEECKTGSVPGTDGKCCKWPMSR